MEFVDTHCHLSDPAYDVDRKEVIQRALDEGVDKMLQADTCKAERGAMLSLCEAYPGILYPMLGLYPGNVDDNSLEELDEVYSLAEAFLQNRTSSGGSPRFVAIGEIGLDYHFSTEFAQQQKDALRAQLELAARVDLPVNIHLRDATEDFFDILESCKGLGVRGNLHAFSGSAQTAARLRKYGDWSVGLGGVVTFKNARIAKELPEIPLEMILLETDAPYLSPTPYRGSRNESCRIPLIAQFIADAKGLPLEQVASQTTANAFRLFAL